MILPVFVPDLKSYRDSPSNFLDRSQLCPSCGASGLESHGSRLRWIFTATERLQIPVFRLRCARCGTTVTLLPDLVLPRIRYCADIVQEAVTAYLTTADSYRRIAVRLAGVALPDDQSATDALLTLHPRPSYQRIHAWIQRLAEQAARLSQDLTTWLLRLRPDSHLLHLLASQVPTFEAKGTTVGKRRQLRDAALLRILCLETPELAPRLPSPWLGQLHRLALRRPGAPSPRGSPPGS